MSQRATLGGLDELTPSEGSIARASVHRVTDFTEERKGCSWRRDIPSDLFDLADDPVPGLRNRPWESIQRPLPVVRKV